MSFSYWTAANPGPLGLPGRLAHLALAALLTVALAASLIAWRRKDRLVVLWAAETALSVSALVTIGLRLAALPAASARLWVAGLALPALALPVLARSLLPQWPVLRQGWLDLWALRPAGRQPTLGAACILLAFHILALAVTVRLLRWPAWSLTALLLILLGPQLLARALRPSRPFSLLAGSAFLPAYLLAGYELLRRLALHASPLLTLPRLPLAPVLLILAGYALAYQVHDLWPRLRGALLWSVPALVAGASLGWAVWAYLSLYARGVSGSDPYCYVQMAVDWLRHGTVLHRFSLLPLARQANLYPGPILHIGYRDAVDAAGWAPTVWPAGHSILLGLAGRLAGEPALYLATPLMALASIVATLWLGNLLFADLRPRWRWLATALAAALVATSFEQLRWLLVHMADISTQLFSTLTLVLVWLGVRRGRHIYALAAGLALALAYWTRHTQLAMALPALAIIALAPLPEKSLSDRPNGCSLRRLGAPTRGYAAALRIGSISVHTRLLAAAICLGAAFLGALPDLAYHWLLFGSPLRPESKELALYTLRAVPATTLLLLEGWLAAPELGYLAPFLLAGALALWRRNRPVAQILGLWLLGLWAVQAPYASLRLRDLLPALPALALLSGYGVAWALSWLAERRRAAAVVLALAVALLLWLRTGPILQLPVTRGFNNFGYLWASQRAEFAALREGTEPRAAIGATLNSGPVELYGERDAFLPADWQPAEYQRFLQALWDDGRPVYLLDDGLEMAAVLDSTRQFARVAPVATLRRIPYYDPAGGSDLRDVTLYQVRP